MRSPIALFLRYTASVAMDFKMIPESSTATTEQTAQIRFYFRYGANRKNLDKLLAYFSPGGYLSEYRYVVGDTRDGVTIFDVIYNSETAASHDVRLEVGLAFRSLS